MQKTTPKIQSAISIIPRIILCILGICTILAGITGLMRLEQETGSYETVEGYCSAYVHSYTNSDGNAYYKWTYSYMVNDQEYSITTGFNANFAPAIGSTRTIKYNPSHPRDAFIPSMSFYNILIFAGIIITVSTLISILDMYLKYCPVDLKGIIKGLTFAILGFGVNYLLSGSFSIISTYNAFGTTTPLIIIFPAVFIAVGICMAVRSLFRKTGSKEDLVKEEGWIDMNQ